MPLSGTETEQACCRPSLSAAVQWLIYPPSRAHQGNPSGGWQETWWRQLLPCLRGPAFGPDGGGRLGCCRLCRAGWPTSPPGGDLGGRAEGQDGAAGRTSDRRSLSIDDVGTFGWPAVVGATVEALEPDLIGAGTTVPTTVETGPALVGASIGLVVPAAAGGAADFFFSTS